MKRFIFCFCLIAPAAFGQIGGGGIGGGGSAFSSVAGTAGQALVNGGTAAVNSGAITLSLAPALTGITSINGLGIGSSGNSLTFAGGSSITDSSGALKLNSAGGANNVIIFPTSGNTFSFQNNNAYFSGAFTTDERFGLSLNANTSWGVGLAYAAGGMRVGQGGSTAYAYFLATGANGDAAIFSRGALSLSFVGTAATLAGTLTIVDQTLTRTNSTTLSLNQGLAIGGSLATNSINAGGAISLTAAGTTISFKSGANAAAGTVTLVGGTATITSTAITANSVIFFSEKTAGGTPGIYQPLAAVSSGSATVTSAATDTSTYNWIAETVN